MTLRFGASSPATLLKNFKKKINQTEREGKINTWEEHKDGFRHTSDNWKDKALFKASVSDNGEYLHFTISNLKDEYAYAYYHGHLLQTFIEHLNAEFTFCRFFDGRTK